MQLIGPHLRADQQLGPTVLKYTNFQVMLKTLFALGKPSRRYSGLTHVNEDTTSSESEDQSDSDEAINDFMDLVI